MKNNKKIILLILISIISLTGCGLGNLGHATVNLSGPESEENLQVSRGTFIKKLIEAEDIEVYEDGDIIIEDVPMDDDLYPYLVTAICRGIWNTDEGFVFNPDNPIDRGTAVLWTVRGLGIMSTGDSDYTDIFDEETAQAAKVAVNAGMIAPASETSFQPDESLSINEMDTILTGAENYFETLMDESEHSQLIVLQDNVVGVTSADNTNVPVAYDSREKTITFTNADDNLSQMEEGNIIYIEPCDNFKDGFLAKVSGVNKSNDNITFYCEEPALEEVISDADFALTIPLGVFEMEDDGDDQLEVEYVSQSYTNDLNGVGSTSVFQEKDLGDGFGLEYEGRNFNWTDDDNNSESNSNKNGITVEDNSFDSDGNITSDVDLDFLNRKLWWTVSGSANENGHFKVSTKSFAEKKGLYASLDMSLEANVALTLKTTIEMLQPHLSSLTFSTKVNTNITGIAGYSNGTTGTLRFKLPTIKYPIEGSPIILTIKPTLVGTVTGEFNVEATVTIDSNFGYTCSVAAGQPFTSTHINDTTVNSGLALGFDGKLEVGPSMGISVQLCGTPFFDGAELLKGDYSFGIGLSGSFSNDISVSIDNNANVKTSGNFAGLVDENGVKHDCYVCITGEIYSYRDADIGLGSELKELVNKISEGDYQYQFSRKQKKLTDYHFSTGDGYSDEFEKRLCPHKSYQTIVAVNDSKTKTAISGANITCGDESASAPATFYLKNGKHKISASAEKYVDGGTEIVINGAKMDVTIELQKKIDGPTNVKGTFLLSKNNKPAKNVTYYVYNENNNAVAMGQSDKSGEYEFTFENEEGLTDSVQEFNIYIYYKNYPVIIATRELNVGDENILDPIYISNNTEKALMYLTDAYQVENNTFLVMQEINLGEDSFTLDIPDYYGGIAYTSYFSLSGLSTYDSTTYYLKNGVTFGSIYTGYAPEGSLTNAMIAIMSSTDENLIPKSFRNREMSTATEIKQFIDDYVGINGVYPVYMVEKANSEVRGMEPSFAQ